MTSPHATRPVFNRTVEALLEEPPVRLEARPHRWAAARGFLVAVVLVGAGAIASLAIGVS